MRMICPENGCAGSAEKDHHCFGAGEPVIDWKLRRTTIMTYAGNAGPPYSISSEK